MMCTFSRPFKTIRGSSKVIFGYQRLKYVKFNLGKCQIEVEDDDTLPHAKCRDANVGA